MSGQSSGWTEFILDELCEFQNGYAFRNSDYVDAGDGSVQVFKMGNIRKGGGLNTDTNCSMVSFEQAKRLEKFILNKSDIVMCMTDMKANMNLLGHTALIDEGGRYLQNQRVGRITVKAPELLDWRFLYFYTNSPEYIDALRSVAHSGVQVNLSTEEIKSSIITAPPLPTQKKIASVLSAYDDLIENNERRIKILEEMAQSIYREWFVNYRFPGHENSRMVDSELGVIPEGWKIQNVEKSFDTLGGGTPSKAIDEYWDEGHINWYTPSDLTREKSMFMDRSGSQITGIGLSKSSASLFPAGSVMMTSRATIGKVSIAASEACTNQGFITCLPNDTFPSEYIYFWLMDNTEQFIQSASGTTFLEIGRRVFRDIPLKVPDDETMSLFTEAVRPLMQHVHTQERQNQNLRQTRDLLLPKLISGELDVEELDIAVA